MTRWAARLVGATRALAVVVVAVFTLFLARDFARRHPEHVPWAPLDLAAPIGWATAGKLAHLRDHPAACRALLARAGVLTGRVAPRADGPGCSVSGALAVDDPGIALVPGDVAASCPLAAALTVWSRRVVAPAAVRDLGAGATALTDLGSYNCRRIAGTARLSEHATANAIYIAGVRLRDGRRLTIAGDWADPGARGRFVRDLRAGACRVFGVVLSPDYNAAHRDHLHLDMGAGRVCG